MTQLRRLLAALLILAPQVAVAQQYNTLPPNSIVANVTGRSAPGNALAISDFITLLNLTNPVPAYTLRGNPTAATAVPTDFSSTAGVMGWLATPSSTNLLAAMTDKTGTGAVVFANSPVLVTPNLGTPSAVNLANGVGLPLASVSGLGTGVQTALGIAVGTAGAPVVNGGALGTPSSGVGTNLTALTATQLTGGTIPAARTNGHQNGTATNDNAAAGEVGEYVESVLAVGSATSLTTGTAKTIVTLSLTAGDWDVSCAVSFLPAGTTSVTQTAASASLTTNTLDLTNGRAASIATAAQVPTATTIAVPTMPLRFSFAGTTSVFCIGFANFTVSTMTAYGTGRARRAR